MGRLTCVLLIALALLWGGRAQGAAVAILRRPSDAPALSEALFRLQGELLAVGLAVATAERPPGHDTRSTEARAWLERTASENGFDAFIDVVGERAPVAVDVWLCERSPRRLRVSRVVLEPDAQDPSATLAIRAIDVLRSSFLAIDLAGARPPPAPPSQPPRAEKPSSTPAGPPGSRFGIAAGAAALTSLDGVGPSILPLVRLDWDVGSWLTLQATGAGFGTSSRVEAGADSVQVAQDFAMLGLCLCHPTARGFHPFVSVAAGALHTALDGQASPPHHGHRLNQWAALMDAGFGMALNVPRLYYLSLAAHVQIAAPYVAIHAVDTVVATTGRPNLLLTLTVGAWL